LFFKCDKSLRITVEALEAEKADEISRIRGRLYIAEEAVQKLTIENAALKEWLRLWKSPQGGNNHEDNNL